MLKRKMEKRLIIDLVLIVLLVALIIVAVYGIFSIDREGMKCLSSPVTYGLNEISEANGIDAECFCNLGLAFNRTTIIKRSVGMGEWIGNGN